MEFVPFEIAKSLKEKGFDYPCIAHYDINKELKVVIREPIFWHSDVLSYTDAPTISQVLKWLREEKKIHICISYSDNINTMWEYEVILLDGALYQNADDAYMIYEEAVFAGIEYVLDNLI